MSSQRIVLLSKRLTLVGFILLFSLVRAHAQVNLQNGSATFNLPIFNWQDDKGRLTSLVNLNYNSGNGLKVNDVASNVGQGWNLNVGGVIARMQVGEPDDQPAHFSGSTEQDNDLTKYPAGYLYHSIDPALGCPNSLIKYPIYKSMNQLYSHHNLEQEDKQLDHFSFQFNGKSGMFILDTTGGDHGIPLNDTKMKITFTRDPTMTSQGIRTTITSFAIQDVDGLIYKFAQHGLTRVLCQEFCDKNLTTPIAQPTFKSGGTYYQYGFQIGYNNKQMVNPWIIGSWYLSEIDDPLTGRKISLSYGYTRTINNYAGADVSWNQWHNYVIIANKNSVTTVPGISSVTYPDGHYILFNYSATPRVDMSGDPALASIDIEYQGRYLSEYQFNTTYFLLNRYGNPTTPYQRSVARLCLKSVKKIGVDLKEDSPPYTFDYFTGSNATDDFVPPPFFYAKDVWGFYNGNNSVLYDNSGPIPLNLTSVNQLNFQQLQSICYINNTTANSYTDPVSNFGVYGVYLNAKPGYAQNGLLKQIVYPTGGSLNYQYAQNTGILIGNTAVNNLGGVHVSQTSVADGGYSNGCANPVVNTYSYVMNGAGSASSLWGMEKPINMEVNGSHYAPEQKGFHCTWTSGCGCYWHYMYPGILSVGEAISLSTLQNFMTAIAPVLTVLSTICDVLDIVNVCLDATPAAIVAVILDAVAILVTIGISCFHNYNKDGATPVYHNSNLNDVSPLPAQFKRVEIVENPGTIGKTVQEFTSSDDYALWLPGANTAFSAKQRYAPWAYGLPKRITTYDNAGNMIKQTQHVYDFTTAHELIDTGPCGGYALVAASAGSSGTPVAIPAAMPAVTPSTSVTTASTVKMKTFPDLASVASTVPYSQTAALAHAGTIPQSVLPNLTVQPLSSAPGSCVALASCKCMVEYSYSQRNTDWTNPSTYVYNTGNYSTGSNSNLLVDIYSMYAGHVLLDSTYERVYRVGDPTQYVQTYTAYQYNYYTFGVASITTMGSDGAQHYKTISYSSDFSGGLFDVMWNNNILLDPVATQTSVYSFATGTHLLSEKVTEFVQVANGNIKPSRILEQRFSTPPGGWASYPGPANVNYANYKIIQTFAYDGSSNLTGMKDEGNRAVTKIYDYYDKYITASVINADPVADKPAATSFEGTGWTGWSLTGTGPVYSTTSFVTGTRGFTMTGNTLTAAIGNTAKAYILSFWASTSGTTVTGGATLAKSGPTYNGMTYYEYSIAAGTASVAVAGSSVIDELRLYPSNARMYTTTYDPLIGKTSDCDENNRIAYYSYDNLGRLQFVKDENRNVTKMYEYNNVSATKQNGCPSVYYSRMLSETVYRSNCAAGYQAGAATFTLPANKYTSTVSQWDADIQAEIDLLLNAQNYANTNGGCSLIYYNTAQSQQDSTQSCNEGYIGGMVTYTVPAGRYSSIISQADANQQAQDEVTANAQSYADDPAHAICTLSPAPDWTWLEGAPTYCSSASGLPPHQFVLETDLNPGSPTYNQTRWMDAGPQDYCPAGNYYNNTQSQTFTRNNCSGGSAVTYSVATGTYTSTTSQAAADQLALNDIAANGQNYANAHGTCCTPTFTFVSGLPNVHEDYSISGTTATWTFVFTWPSSGTGFTIGNITPACAWPTAQRTVPILQNGNTYNVIFYTNGQVLVQLVSGTAPSNTTIGLHGVFDLVNTTYYSAAASGYFVRNNCPAGQTGSGATYTVAQYAEWSTVSQADANQKAVNDVNASGQNYANSVGTCSIPCSFTWSSTITNHLSANISSTGTAVSFQFAFLPPSNGWYSGTLGTITGGCVPSAYRYVTVTDGASPTRTWYVTIAPTGVVSVSMGSGPATTTSYPPIVINGSFAP